MKKIFLVFILLTILTAGCITGTEDSVSYERGESKAITARMSTSDAMPAPQAEYEDAGGGTTTTRKVIVTTNIDLEVRVLEDAIEKIEAIAHKYDGFVSNSYLNAEDEYKTGSITIRVPAEKHDIAIKEATGVGEVKSKSTSGRDVTEEYIDLEARLNNLIREEKRLIEILDLAKEVKDLIEVERELSRVRGEIERLTGRKKYLDDRIDFSTITVNLEEPEPVTYDWGVSETLSRAIEGFFSTISSVIILIGYLLPIAVLYAIFKAIKRRRKTD